MFNVLTTSRMWLTEHLKYDQSELRCAIKCKIHKIFKTQHEKSNVKYLYFYTINVEKAF